jgi:hypothetical protein
VSSMISGPVMEALTGRASSAPHALRRRQTHWLERADSRMTDSSFLYINQQSPNSSGSVG